MSSVRGIIKWKPNLKESKTMKEQKVKAYYLIEQHHDVFS